MQSLLDGPAYPLLLGALCGIVGFRVGWRSGNRWAFPVLQGSAGFLAFLTAWRIGGAIDGTLAVAAWAAGSTLVSLPTFRRWPERADERVLRARVYRESMLEWLRTGRGPEAEPLATVRRHLRELALYLAAALASANLLSLIMGAALLNYMNAYVAHLLGAARARLRVALLAWNSWSVVRVASYVVLGSACAQGWAEVLGWAAEPAEVRWLFALGAAGVVLDLVLKLTLARPWGRWLAAAVDLDPRPAE